MNIKTNRGTGLAMLLLTGLAFAATPFAAVAAELTISNCQNDVVRICSYNNQTARAYAQSDYVMQHRDQKTFTCNGENCYIKIVDCGSSDSCGACDEDGLWVKGAWLTDFYDLTSLDLANATTYANDDLESGSSEVCG